MSSQRIILMRHADAEPESGAGDHARPLSHRGRSEGAQAGRRMAALLRPDLVLASDSARTRATVEQLSACFTPALPHGFTRGLYCAAAEAILEEVRVVTPEVHHLLVVGHNPGIGDLARALAGSGEPAALAALRDGFPTSCFAVLALDVAGWSEIGAPGRLDGLFPSDGRPDP